MPKQTITIISFLFVAFFVAFSCATPLQGESSYGSGPRVSASNESAVLYYNPGCPHCKKVISYLNSQNRSISMKNTSNPTYRAELNALGHRGVPVLAVGGRTISGSDAIIIYLKQHE